MSSDRFSILRIHIPAIEVATGDRIFPVPVRFQAEFKHRYPHLRMLEVENRTPGLYRCEECGQEMRFKHGPIKDVHFFHLTTTGCSLGRDEDRLDAEERWISESPAHRMGKHVLRDWLNRQQPIHIFGVGCCVSGCTNSQPDHDLIYLEGDTAIEEHPISGGRADVAVTNSDQVRFLFEVYHHHRTMSRPGYTWFEFRAEEILFRYEAQSRLNVEIESGATARGEEILFQYEAQSRPNVEIESGATARGEEILFRYESGSRPNVESSIQLHDVKLWDCQAHVFDTSRISSHLTMEEHTAMVASGDILTNSILRQLSTKVTPTPSACCICHTSMPEWALKDGRCSKCVIPPNLPDGW